MKRMPIIEAAEEAVVRAFHGSPDILKSVEEESVERREPVQTFEEAQEDISFYLFAGLMTQGPQ